MRFPRLGMLALNTIGLVAFAVTTALVQPAQTNVASGYTALFLMWLALVLVAHLGLRKRWNGAMTAIVCVVTFGMFTTLGDHVVAGLIAAAQMWMTLRFIPRYVPVARPIEHPAARTSVEVPESEEFEEWKAWRAARAAGQVH